MAAQAIQRIAALNRVEADGRLQSGKQQLQMRDDRFKPLWQELHLWLQLERQRVPDGSAMTKAIAHSLNHWQGSSRFLLDGAVPIDNNPIENQIRSWVFGRRKGLFIDSQLAGESAAVVMGLLQSGKPHGHEPWTCLKDVLTRLPAQLNSRLGELLLHRWHRAD